MDYNNRPAWYIAQCARWDCFKHGTTLHLPFRKDPFFTCTPDPVQYRHCFLLDPTSLTSDLYTLDSVDFPAWLHSKGYSTRLERGGGTEFYQHDDPVAIAREFFASAGVRVLEELTDDSLFPYPSSRESEAVLRAEDAKRSEAKEKAPKDKHAVATLKARFLAVYGLTAFRRIQEEVWDCWATLLKTQRKYRGIVQWPTGTGKTVAELILILLCFEHVKKSGGIYRGLLIAPKNDILNTQMKEIKKLEAFGIAVIEAHEGRFSSTSFPEDKHCLIVVTHAALAMRKEPTDSEEEALVDAVADFVGMNKLPKISHIHYDEVHRATGERFFTALLAKCVEWGEPYITGTSATPKTSDKTQHAKLARLFGDPFTILHRCDIDEAVREGWIAPPRFWIAQIEDTDLEKQVLSMLRQTVHLMVRRIATGMCQGGKAIVYFGTLEEVQMAYRIAHDEFPDEWRSYKATRDATATDRNFVTDKADGTPRILFACEKYREGSDIKGLEFTAVLMGHEISAHILLQIAGRALRTDYPGKEGWCCIVRPRFKDDESDDVLLSVLLDMEALICKTPGVATKKDAREAFIRTYFGTITLDGRPLDVAETVERAQDMYLRREYDANRLSLADARIVCREHGIADSAAYAALQETTLTGLPADPAAYWRGHGWTSWHDYLHGTDRAVTQEDFIERVIRADGLRTAEQWEASSFRYPGFPTLQQIVDGYFAATTDFSALVAAAGVPRRR